LENYITSEQKEEEEEKTMLATSAIRPKACFDASKNKVDQFLSNMCNKWG
jgi:hypothetical protein